MKEYQERVVKEQQELSEKMTKLYRYIHDNGISFGKSPHESMFDCKKIYSEEAQLLNEQLVYMEQYNNILVKRIKLFKEN